MANLYDLSIVIPNYNGAKLLPEHLPSVLQAVAKFSGSSEIIVVDDGSRDESLTVLDKFSGIRVLKHEVNKGFSSACNTGIAAAKGRIIFLLNTDVTLSEDFFQYHEQRFAEYKDLFAITVKAYHMRTKELIDGQKSIIWKRGTIRATINTFPEYKNNDFSPIESHSVQGAYFFADAEKLRQLGGFDEIYNPYMLEETDLAFRALMRGWKIFYEPRCIAYHDHSSSVKKHATRYRIRVISERNRYIFVWKNVHTPRFLVLHVLFIGLNFLLLRRVKIIAFLEALKRWGSVMVRRRVELNSRVMVEQIILLKKFH